MKTNPRLKAVILEIVDNQLRENTPPETRQTYERLLADGYTDQAARELIGAAMTSEIYEILQYKRPYNQKHYLKALRRLPRLPWE
jgi:hypothetical protein